MKFLLKKNKKSICFEKLPGRPSRQAPRFAAGLLAALEATAARVNGGESAEKSACGSEMSYRSFRGFKFACFGSLSVRTYFWTVTGVMSASLMSLAAWSACIASGVCVGCIVTESNFCSLEQDVGTSTVDWMQAAIHSRNTNVGH